MSPTQPDPVLATTTRLSIVAMLGAVQEMEFAAVRDAVGLSDSALSKQAGVLEQAGYLAIRKGDVGKRPRTWLRITPTGRAALTAHVAALHAIVSQAGESLLGAAIDPRTVGGAEPGESPPPRRHRPVPPQPLTG